VPNKLSPKLVEMGLHMGSHITVMNRAPFHGPMAIDLGSSVLSLRLDEAELVLVEEMA
jgi:Fe2+ transport system protein FeoA